MNVNLTAKDLIDFEEEVCKNFADKKIRAPIHLYDGCENQMMAVFNNMVEEDDWVMCSWRSHYQCLLKGVPKDQLMEAILDGKSISLCFPRYNIVSSAIVGGILPVALGTALGIKKQDEANKVICFMGEMTSETGIAHECIKYSINHDLPILWVIEDNGKSVCTPTLTVWNMNQPTYSQGTVLTDGLVRVHEKIIYYKYTSKFPHAGGASRVQF